MNIALVSTEIFPFCKTGGLGDVAGALMQNFSKTENVKIVGFVPKYREIDKKFKLKKTPIRFKVVVGKKAVNVGIYEYKWGKARMYFIDCPKYFNRNGLYGPPGGGYNDNDERFIVLCKSVLQCLKYVGFKTDILHCHDWPTGLLPIYLKTFYKVDDFFAKTKTVFTVHNMSYQGCFGKKILLKIGFGYRHPIAKLFEYGKQISFLKAGLLSADELSIVSPTYLKEVQTTFNAGRGMQKFARQRKKDFVGIINGIDTKLWNPEKDIFIPKKYSARNFIEGKKTAKAKLQKQVKLEIKPNVPLAGIVSRLDYQKGLDVLLQSLSKHIEKMQLVVLGVGDKKLTAGFSNLSEKYPERVHFHSFYDESFAHRIYAASDFFIMPSRFEPCGLGQMIAMRYGALPLVTKTGGLADTVKGYPANKKLSSGFVARRCAKADILKTLELALRVYPDRKVWNKLVKNAMNSDFSWEKSTKSYLNLFKKVLSRK
jgi:starch synthase